MANPVQAPAFLNGSVFFGCPSAILRWAHPKCRSCFGKRLEFTRRRLFATRGARLYLRGDLVAVDRVKKSSIEYETGYLCEGKSENFPHIQTLKNFPKEELSGKVVMVRFDSSILLGEKLDKNSLAVSNALFTVQYLLATAEKVILVSDWKREVSSKLLDSQSVSDILSSLLRRKVVSLKCLSCGVPFKRELLEEADIFLLENLSGFRKEVANCPEFSELLSSEVDVFVNDSFSLSHRVLASTVGISRFSPACVAGFQFEESLRELKRVLNTDKRPYIAIIGGANIHGKAAALKRLVSECDGVVFVGMMSLQIMHALEYSIPSTLLEPGSSDAAVEVIQSARYRKIPIITPKDFWCINDSLGYQIEVIPAHRLGEGWVPVDLGPRSLYEMDSLLSSCKKVIWIGPVQFKSSHSSICTDGASQVAQIVDRLAQRNCEIAVVGNKACSTMIKESRSSASCSVIENASVVWEVLKGRKLPGLLALDRAFPFKIDWTMAYRNPAQPLVVDIGSGNGLFLFGMASRRKDQNFLGLEVNKKLVRRCLDGVRQSGIPNGFFIATNATSTFRSIVSSYPGEVVLVSIQCPNPDFNNPEQRWRMVNRTLVEAVVELLAYNGKVFLQSDIETVVLRMTDMFLRHSKGKLSIVRDGTTKSRQQGSWLHENPFGVRSDWEQHVLDRGDPMYRLMLCKSATS
ncbi:unnamed protein product [Linum trigynum]|uniref:Phosphoglycerate kinase n=1 Tax=Linum trigynum TaxID=586398 RepID=A0AAV2FLU0_9ROSI